MYRNKTIILVYSFNAKDVYIAGNKNSQSILKAIDQAIEQLELKEENPSDILSEKYFGTVDRSDQYIHCPTSFIIYFRN